MTTIERLLGGCIVELFSSIDLLIPGDFLWSRKEKQVTVKSYGPFPVKNGPYLAMAGGAIRL